MHSPTSSSQCSLSIVGGGSFVCGGGWATRGRVTQREGSGGWRVPLSSTLNGSFVTAATVERWEGAGLLQCPVIMFLDRQRRRASFIPVFELMRGAEWKLIPDGLRSNLISTLVHCCFVPYVRSVFYPMCVFVLNETHNQNTAPLPWNHLTRSRSTDTKPHPEAVLLSWRDSGSCCLWDWPAERFGFLLLLLYLETSSRGYFCWNVICSSRRLIRVRKVRSDVCRIPRHAVCPPIKAKWLIVHRFGFSHLVAHVISIYWSWRCLYHKAWRLNWLN